MPDLSKNVFTSHRLDGASLNVLQSPCSQIGPLLIDFRHRLIERAEDAIGNTNTFLDR
jgi:hypothetical protein